MDTLDNDQQQQQQQQQQRPSSAPPIQPRPPSSRPRSVRSGKGGKVGNFVTAPTLNPTYLQSYPLGIKTSQRMKQRHEKSLLSQSYPSSCGARGFSSVTKPFSYYNASYKHLKSFPHIPSVTVTKKGDTAGGGGANPRVLVWGEGEGTGTSRMLAVGDHVMTNIHSECVTHGHLAKQQPAVVKYIGFVNGRHNNSNQGNSNGGNQGDVYVGLRLQEDIGYTDGTIEGKRYFRCEPEKGAFVHLSDIVKVVHSNTKHVPPLASM